MADSGESSQRDSRVLVLSQRNLHTPLFHALQYELEDLLVRIDDTVVLSPLPQGHVGVGELSRRTVNGVRRRTGLPRSSPPGNRPSMRPMQVTGEHDLFFAVFHDAYQLSYLHRLKGWRERSRRAVCLLMEVWTPGVAPDADYFALLRDFDAVYAFTPAAAPALARLGSPLPSFLPIGVDALRAQPGPRPPERSIDVYTYGRTSPVLHEQLVHQAASDGLTYLYDTMDGGNVLDHAEHRALLANLMKRSRFFLAHRINDSPGRQGRTGSEESLSTRYFEASAGGAVMLGSEPQTPHFRDCFDWTDAVIRLPYESRLVMELLRDLTAEPERLAAARQAGVRAGLTRHDWTYRWERILADAGLPPEPGLLRRRADLEQAAAETVSP